MGVAAIAASNGARLAVCALTSASNWPLLVQPVTPVVALLIIGQAGYMIV